MRTRPNALEHLSDVTRVILEWPEGRTFSALEAVRQHPYLGDSPQLLIDLAVHEFAERRAQQDSINLEAFLLDYPVDVRSELREAIQVDRGLTILSGLVSALQSGTGRRVPENITWPETGETFAGFRLEELLGQGGFSRVFAARELQFEERRVALKICRIDTHEPGVLADLQHAGIGTVHSVTKVPERGLTAICMPLLSRTTLLDIRNHVWSHTHCPTTSRQVWECVRQGNQLRSATPLWAESSYCEWVLETAATLARALAFSHEHGVVHCDIKPSNILIGEDGRPILFDFNVAFRESATNRPANVGGTVPYMSPEQITAFTGSGTDGVGPRSDLYSLGATVYELLAGTPPFGTVQSLQTGTSELLSIRRSAPVPVRHRNPGVPAEFAEVIDACLSFDPDSRPESAASLADQLERMKKHLGRRASSMHRFVAASAATVAACAVAAAVFIHQTPDRRLVATSPLQASGLLSESTAAEASHSPLSPDQVSRLLDQAWQHLDDDQADQAIDGFLRILDDDQQHAGAAIGLMRAAIRLPTRPESVLARRIPHVFNPMSVPELQALSGTALAGALTANFTYAESRLRQSINAGFSNDTTRHNLAVCLFAQGRYQESESILKDIIADGDAPDVSRLLLARILVGQFVSDSIQTLPAQGSLIDLIADQKFEQIIEPCDRSALKSLTLAQIHHCSCVLFDHYRQHGVHDLTAEERHEWMTRSLGSIDAFQDSIELGMSPWLWSLFAGKLHPDATETPSYRTLSSKYLFATPRHQPDSLYRRRFILDPVAGTPFEHWTERSIRTVSRGIAPRRPSRADDRPRSLSSFAQHESVGDSGVVTERAAGITAASASLD